MMSSLSALYFGAQLLQHGQLGLAGRAPGGPEHDEGHLALVGGKVFFHGAHVQGLQLGGRAARGLRTAGTGGQKAEAERKAQGRQQFHRVLHQYLSSKAARTGCVSCRLRAV